MAEFFSLQFFPEDYFPNGFYADGQSGGPQYANASLLVEGVGNSTLQARGAVRAALLAEGWGLSQFAATTTGGQLPQIPNEGSSGYFVRQRHAVRRITFIDAAVQVVGVGSAQFGAKANAVASVNVECTPAILMNAAVSERRVEPGRNDDMELWLLAA